MGNAFHFYLANKDRMTCEPTTTELNKIAEHILQGKHKPLGKGTFGAVYHIGHFIIKKINMKNEYDVKDFEHEVSVWKHLAAIPAMRPFMPQFCQELIIQNVPFPPNVQGKEYNSLPYKNRFDSWLIDETAWQHKYKDEYYAYGFIFQLYEPVRDLHDVFKDAVKTPFSAYMGYKLFTEITMGFTILHDAGIVHNDIKPNNILIRKDGTPIIIDFGLACELFDVHGKRQACEYPYRGKNEFIPQNYKEVENRTHLPGFFTHELKGVKQVAIVEGLIHNTTKMVKVQKPIKVKLRGVADPINNKASDMYTLSISVLRPLFLLTDWSSNRRYEKEVKETIQEYERAIVPFLAASLGNKWLHGVNRAVATSKRSSKRSSSHRKSTHKKASK
jgi:serine/threonine protein kinase